MKGVMPISNTLIFISNELLATDKRRVMHLPLVFISFGFIEGKLYKHFKNDGTFMLEPHNKAWGNNVVYGAIFALSDYDFYIRLLDSYHQCSMSLLGINHSKDVHHRIEVHATPIAFNTWDDFIRLKYSESPSYEVQAYVGNLNHPKITQRLNKTNLYRIESGVDPHYKQIFREVTHDKL